MSGAVFLSAGVPDPRRFPRYAQSADTIAITAAVSALVYVTLGRRRIVWGGQPAITPMIWAAAEDIGVSYGSWVHLYQSLYFKDEFPEDNARFRNVTFTLAVNEDRAASLRLMRERMLSEHRFESAVFIGGMDGILEEFDLFQELQPNATVLPVFSTGGAVLDLVQRVGGERREVVDELDFVSLYHQNLGIPPEERRYATPEEQPASQEQRRWSPGPL